MTAGPRTNHAMVNGVRIKYTERGAGYPVLLLHGFPQTSHSWRKVAPILAERFRVIAPDLRGFGDSDKPPEASAYGVRTLAKDMADLMAHLGAERCAVVGHDLGGGVAYRMALDYPGLVRHLVPVSMGYPLARAQQPPDQARLMESWYVYLFLQPGELAEHLLGTSVDTLVRHLLDRWTVRPEARTAGDVREYVRAFREPGGLHGALCHYRARYGEDVPVWEADADRRIGQPTLAIWGERDVVVPPRRSDGMQRYLTDLRFHWVEECGHFPQEEAPEEFCRALIGFLEARPSV